MDKPEKKSQPGVNLFGDRLFIILFTVMLVDVLFGFRGCAGAARIMGLGTGWPEIFQGGLALLCLILLAVRAMQLMRRQGRG